jgi:hypothetical protein
VTFTFYPLILNYKFSVFVSFQDFSETYFILAPYKFGVIF